MTEGSTYVKVLTTLHDSVPQIGELMKIRSFSRGNNKGQVPVRICSNSTANALEGKPDWAKFKNYKKP